jgi:hypothetical protein
MLPVLVLVCSLLLFFSCKTPFFLTKDNSLSYFISSIIFLSPV